MNFVYTMYGLGVDLNAPELPQMTVFDLRAEIEKLDLTSIMCGPEFMSKDDSYNYASFYWIPYAEILHWRRLAACIKRAKMKTRPTLTADYFDHYSEKSYDETYTEFFDAQYILDEFIEGSDLALPHNLLDLGAASGKTLTDFSSKGIQSYGIELFGSIVHKAISTTPSLRHILVQGDFLVDLPLVYADNQFDCIYSMSFAYVEPEDLQSVLKDCLQILKPSGILVNDAAFDHLAPDIPDKDRVLAGSIDWWRDQAKQAGFNPLFGGVWTKPC